MWHDLQKGRRRWGGCGMICRRGGGGGVGVGEGNWIHPQVT